MTACSTSPTVLSANPDPAAPRSALVPFIIDRPLTEGSVTVTGRGPAKAPIILYDVTFMGVELGRTSVDGQGKFTFSVAPLQRGHRLGLALGDLAGTPWTKETLNSEQYFGPGAMQVPQVGFFNDTVIVTAE